jgi:predicted SnoaL-like aldol condensation-catalyzing enzyme
MSIQQNKALALRWQEAVFNQCQLHLIDELLAPDFMDHASGGQGLAAAKAMFTYVIENTPSTHVATEELIAEGDKVVLRWTQHNGE